MTPDSKDESYRKKTSAMIYQLAPASQAGGKEIPAAAPAKRRFLLCVYEPRGQNARKKLKRAGSSMEPEARPKKRRSGSPNTPDPEDDLPDALGEEDVQGLPPMDGDFGALWPENEL